MFVLYYRCILLPSVLCGYRVHPYVLHYFLSKILALTRSRVACFPPALVFLGLFL